MPAQFLRWAQEACNYVHRVLPFGSHNNPLNPFQMEARRKAMLARLDSGLYKDLVFGYDQHTSTPSSVAREALFSGTGSCSEMARLAFVYLRRKGVKPLDVMDLDPNIDHRFLVIGRTTQQQPSNCMQWGNGAVICDPWAGSIPVGGIQQSFTPTVGLASQMDFMDPNEDIYFSPASSLERLEGTISSFESPF